MARRRETGLRREISLRALMSVVFVSIGAADFMALGVTAREAQGMTPLVFVAVGGIMLASLASYVEGIAMMPQAGGSSGFARRAFNELVSFLTAHALMLDYLIIVAMSAYFATHYLSEVPGLERLSESPWDIGFAVALIVLVGLVAARGVGRSARIAMVVGAVTLAAQAALAVLGLVLVFDLSMITSTVELGVTPSWAELAFALPIAMVGFTGMEVAANLSAELRDNARPRLARPLLGAVLTAVALLVTLSAVSLSALPVEGEKGSSLGRLGEDGFVDHPLTGLITELGFGGTAEGALLALFGVLAACTLFLVALASLLASSRLVYSMSRHRQIPSALGRINRRRGAPSTAIFFFALLAAGLLLLTETLRSSALVLAQLYAFGATFSLLVANAAIIQMRIREPELARPFRAGFDVTVRGRQLSLLSVLGLASATFVFVLVLATHEAARVLGLMWLVVGFVGFGTYRLSHGYNLTDRIDPRDEVPLEIEARSYRRILLAVRPEPGRLYGEGDAEVAALAHKLLEDPADGEIVVMLVHELPLTQAISSPLGVIEERTSARVSRLRRATDKLGVRLVTTTARARAAGRAICQEAARRDADAVIMATAARKRADNAVFGKSVSYVLRHAPCDVVVLRFPASSLASVDAAGRAAGQRRQGVAQNKTASTDRVG